MWILVLAGLVAVWAVWVAWEVNKAGGYPPYQDNTTKCNKTCDQDREYDTWPFPRSKP